MIKTANASLKTTILGLSPVHYWPLTSSEISGSTANDIGTATTANGTLVGSPAAVTGDGQDAIEITAAGKYINLTNNAELPGLNTDGQDFSLVIFAKIDSADDIASGCHIFGRDWSSSTDGWTGLIEATGFTFARVSDGSAASDAGNISTPEGVWAMLGMTYDHTTLRLYKNGVNTNSFAATRSVDFTGSGRSWNINRRFETVASEINGSVGHAAAFDSALSPADMLSIYTAATASTSPTLRRGKLSGIIGQPLRGRL